MIFDSYLAKHQMETLFCRSELYNTSLQMFHGNSLVKKQRVSIQTGVTVESIIYESAV